MSNNLSRDGQAEALLNKDREQISQLSPSESIKTEEESQTPEKEVNAETPSTESIEPEVVDEETGTEISEDGDGGTDTEELNVVDKTTGNIEDEETKAKDDLTKEANEEEHRFRENVEEVHSII